MRFMVSLYSPSATVGSWSALVRRSLCVVHFFKDSSCKDAKRNLYKYMVCKVPYFKLVCNLTYMPLAFASIFSTISSSIGFSVPRISTNFPVVLSVW